MPRLGRGRRSKPFVFKAPSVPTPTPFVRRHVVIQTNKASAKLGRIRRRVRLLRPRPAVVAVTASVRPRIIVRMNRLNQLKKRAGRGPAEISRSRVTPRRPVSPVVVDANATRSRRRRRTRPVVSRARAATRTPRRQQALVFTSDRSRVLAYHRPGRTLISRGRAPGSIIPPSPAAPFFEGSQGSAAGFDGSSSASLFEGTQGASQ